MKKLTVVAFALAGLSPLFADVMDKKAAVIKTVETTFAGTAEVTCDDVKGWAFDVSASVDDGRDVVTVRLSRADDASPSRRLATPRSRGDDRLVHKERVRFRK